MSTISAVIPISKTKAKKELLCSTTELAVNLTLVRTIITHALYNTADIKTVQRHTVQLRNNKTATQVIITIKPAVTV